MHVIIPPLKMHSGQHDIMQSKARFKVISAGRRFGKTLLACEWLALSKGSAMDGRRTALFAPIYKDLIDVWNSITNTILPLIKTQNKVERRIELYTGGVIEFWTLENINSGRGRKYHRIVIDEAAHSKNLQVSWERAIAPTLTDFCGEAWFISTPNGDNFFKQLHKRGGSNNWESWQLPTSTNPYISTEEIDRFRLELPELVFKQEYLAEFVAFGAGLVKPEYIVNAPCPSDMQLVIGVDLAISEKSTADWTVMSVMGRDSNTGIIYIKEIERFRASFNDILNKIKAASVRHKPKIIAIENTQYQTAVIQELARTTSLPVRGVRPDRDKITRFAPLLTRYEQKLVRHDPSGCPSWFVDELCTFPESDHDDAIDACSYAFNMLTQANSYAASNSKPHNYTK